MEDDVEHCVLSAIAILQGRIDPSEIYVSLGKIKEKNQIKLVFTTEFLAR